MKIRELKKVINEVPEDRLDEECYIVEPLYADEYKLVVARFSYEDFYLFGGEDE